LKFLLEDGEFAAELRVHFISDAELDLVDGREATREGLARVRKYLKRLGVEI
jgi:hypothetical protein